MIVSPKVSEARESIADLISLQSKKFKLCLFLIFSHLPSNWFFNAKILFAETPSPLSLMSEVAKEPKVSLARAVSVKWKKASW